MNTQLPDGSGFFTAEVMSREDVMSLPPEQRPICYRVSSEIYHATFEAVGAASMCWNPKPTEQVEQSEHASKIALDLLFKFAAEIERLNAARKWNTSEAPKDGTRIVAIGRVICDEGMTTSVYPFCGDVEWTEREGESKGWHFTAHGLSVARQLDDEVKIDFWMPYPTA